MKKLLVNLSVSALLVAAPFVSQAATVVGNLIEAGMNPSTVTFLRFQPAQPAKNQTPFQALGTNTVMPYPVRATVGTNNNFSAQLVGGFYDTAFGNDPKLQTLRILVPLNDTNTYTLNQVAQLAVNASMFGLSNVTITNYIGVPANVVTNNEAGASLPFLTVSGGSFLGLTNLTIVPTNAASIDPGIPTLVVVAQAENVGSTWSVDSEGYCVGPFFGDLAGAGMGRGNIYDAAGDVMSGGSITDQAGDSMSGGFILPAKNYASTNGPGATETLFIQTNSVGPHGYGLQFTNGLYIGKTKY
jgi:hypothetical protein